MRDRSWIEQRVDQVVNLVGLEVFDWVFSESKFIAMMEGFRSTTEYLWIAFYQKDTGKFLISTWFVAPADHSSVSHDGEITISEMEKILKLGSHGSLSIQDVQQKRQAFISKSIQRIVMEPSPFGP